MYVKTGSEICQRLGVRKVENIQKSGGYQGGVRWLGVLVLVFAAIVIAAILWKWYGAEVPGVGWGWAYEQYWGKPTADFEFTDVEGKSRRLSEFNGKPVVLVLWATWCGPCISEIPGLIELQKEMGDKLAIVAISGENMEIVRDFARARGINYVTAGVGEMELPEPFGLADVIPTGFYIDYGGILRKATQGGSVRKR